MLLLEMRDGLFVNKHEIVDKNKVTTNCSSDLTEDRCHETCVS